MTTPQSPVTAKIPDIFPTLCGTNSRHAFITFRVSRRPREMYCGQSRAFVCLSVRSRMPTLLHGPGCNLAEW